jgi:hypothetical protein
MPLLVHRRKITANAAKSGDSRRTAKDASNLLLHFRQAKVLLGLVVGKRNSAGSRKGRPKQSQAKNLLDALLGRAEQVLALRDPAEDAGGGG